MKHPSEFRIAGEKVVLTSYKPEHVPKYHSWMSDVEILDLTGSERLTLEEEYDMQQEWERDDRKCTFIILSRAVFDQTGDEQQAMIGDTNIFLSSSEDDTNPNRACVEGEIEIMIAEESARRKGCATEALKLMMEFGISNLKIQKYFAKIKRRNISSIQLFKKLGFEFESESDVFDEVCLSYFAVKQ